MSEYDERNQDHVSALAIALGVGPLRYETHKLGGLGFVDYLVCSTTDGYELTVATLSPDSPVYSHDFRRYDLGMLTAQVSRALLGRLADLAPSGADGSSAPVSPLHAEVERLRAGIRQCAATLVQWAVTSGGHTPSAIVAGKLRQLVGDEPPPSIESEPV